MRLESHGIYATWTGDRRRVPQILEFTEVVPARVGIEFGCVVRLRGYKGKVLDWRISHPPFRDSDGRRTPDFTGEEHVRTNDYAFYLGDAVWEPCDDKLGGWTMSVDCQGERLATVTFHVVPDTA
ncbi:MAG: DUF3859 domain-containing protein [Planctomycetota bacterium]